MSKQRSEQQDFGGGMVAHLYPDRIPENAYAFAENFECRNGLLSTRRGQTDLFDGVEAGALGPWEPVASCRIADDDGIEHVAFAALGAVDATIRTFAFNHFLDAWKELTFPAGATLKPASVPLDDAVAMFQYGNHLYLMRRSTAQVWRVAVSLASTEWTAVPTSDPGGGANWMPAGAAACVAYGRIWTAVKSAPDDVFDAVACSDITLMGDALQWDLVKHHWQVGEEDHSDIMALVPLPGGKIAVLKRRSVCVLSGCEGYVDAVYVERVEPKHGCVGGGAAVRVGSDVWYLSDDGVRSVALDADNNARALEKPLSLPLSPWWDANIVMSSVRRWQCAAAVYDSYALFTVPYGSASPNAVLAYDVMQGAWAGVWSGMRARQMQMMAHGVERVLVGIDTNGAVQRLLAPDRWGQAAAPTGYLVTRAFNLGSTERRKSFRAGMIGLSSGQATYSLSVLDIDEQRETASLVSVTAASDGWSLWIPDDGLYIPDEGIELRAVGMQRKLFFVGRQARAVQLVLRVESGAMDVRSLAVEGSAGRALSEF